jgi:hypothetical protein
VYTREISAQCSANAISSSNQYQILFQADQYLHSMNIKLLFDCHDIVTSDIRRRRSIGQLNI